MFWKQGFFAGFFNIYKGFVSAFSENAVFFIFKDIPSTFPRFYNSFCYPHIIKDMGKGIHDRRKNETIHEEFNQANEKKAVKT